MRLEERRASAQHPEPAALEPENIRMKRDDDYRPLSIVVGLAFFMEQLDSTIIAPVIPELARAFGVDALSLNLTMTIYLLCSVTFIPVSGCLAGRFGTRSVFKASVTLFVLSSVLCAASTSLPVLAAARALQGASAALMVPVGRTAIVRSTARGDLVLALAWMITPAMVGPLLGPVLGGLISTYASWHWIFLINVPIGFLVWWGASRYLPQIKAETPDAFDLCEWLLLSLMLALVVASLELGRHHAVDVPWWGVLALFAVLTWAYVRRVRRAARPMLDFALLRVPTFHASFWAGSLVRVGYGAVPFLLPLMLQIGLGFSAIQSGLVLLASGAVAFVTKTRTAAILRRFGFRRVLVVNGLLCAAALAACAFARFEWGLLSIAVLVSVGGFFRSIQFNALAAIAYADMPPEKIAAATSLNTMIQQLAVMFGISLSAFVVEHSARAAHRAGPAAFDFALAFLVVSLAALIAVPFCMKLRADSGSDMSGHRAAARAEAIPKT
jgi:EmrB/QacA subfamily drug resistance transporter